VIERQYKRPYLDSSVYIAAINNEPGRAKTVKQIFAAADRSEIELVASTFVAAEVIKMRGQGYLSLDHEVAIESYLKSEHILWVELDLSLAIRARGIARDHSLKPGDAIHLASAIRGKADVLLRFDDRFTANGDIAGIEVCDPYWYGPPELFDA